MGLVKTNFNSYAFIGIQIMSYLNCIVVASIVDDFSDRKCRGEVCSSRGETILDIH